MAHSVFREALEAITPDRLRTLDAPSNAARYNFSTNDYLGLSKHPAVISAQQQAAAQYGAGAGAARLTSGNHALFAETEAALAALKRKQAALLFGSGYLANMTVLPALLAADDTFTVLIDRLAHRSLLDGVIQSGAPWRRFPHNDFNHLEMLALKAARSGKRPFIVVESVYGMDGDIADFAALMAIKERTDAFVYADEAHATGVCGVSGQGLSGDVADVVLGTCGKALGNFGAFIAADAVIRDYLIQKCPGFIYATALPPAVVAGIAAAVALLPQLEETRQALKRRGDAVRAMAAAAGFSTGDSSTHIVPLFCGRDAAALALEKRLYDAGCLAKAIRPPTVPEGTARLRLSLSSVLCENAYAALEAALCTAKA